ncbi:MAG: hypothetical protein WA484_04210 [Solirubrobacteraceae bacterium]
MKTQILIRLTVAALLGVVAAVLVSCGSSGAGLIPSESAGPLRRDFEAVARDAAAGNGSCAATESALGKTEQDFLALPASIDGGLHAHLQEGISNLRKRALEMCIQLTAGATSTEATQTSTTTTTSTETTPTTTTSTTTTPTSTTPTTTTTPPSESGGTEAGEGEAQESAGKGKGKGKREAEGSGGAGAGGASAGGGQ